MHLHKIILLFVTLVTGIAADQTQPNIVFILSDDQGWEDYGFMGHPHIQTPNLDRLAKKGILYERGYVTAPLCRPSLASLVSGLYPHQTGIRGNDPVGFRELRNQKKVDKMAVLRDRMTAPFNDQPSFVQELKAHGYATLQTGKWWEGNPLDHGFTQGMTHGNPKKGGRHGDVGLKIGRETMQPIHDFVDQAIEKDQPFFIWYGVFLPHAPHNAPDRLFQKYKDLAPNEPTAWYWANCEWFDETCGEIETYLKEKGVYDNTIFVYTCDNGWVQDPEKRNRSDGKSKRHPSETGLRTPIFITHPASIHAQRSDTILASNIDIAPTILNIAGIKVPEVMTGLDLRHPEALEKRNRVYAEVYEHDSHIDQIANIDQDLVARVVVDDWMKLIERPDKVELYDLKSDPYETNELHSTAPKTVQRLKKLIHKLRSL